MKIFNKKSNDVEWNKTCSNGHAAGISSTKSGIIYEFITEFTKETICVLNSENHKALISSFRDISRKVSILAIFSPFGPVNPEPFRFFTCCIHKIEVHLYLNMPTKH